MADRPVPLPRSIRAADVPEVDPPVPKLRKRTRSEREGDAAPLPKGRGKRTRHRRGSEPSDLIQATTYTSPILFAPPMLPTTPDGKPLDVVRALIGAILDPRDPTEMQWRAQSDAELRPWLALTNPLGLRFPGVATVLHEVVEETSLDVNGFEEALLAAGITTSDQLIFSSEHSLQYFGNMGLASAGVLRKYAKRLVCLQLGLECHYRDLGGRHKH
ncbi:hypothetical protein DXG01_010472 [Tephrocybe rancida]|nr:hypothetical protein DXG01_010472 [Tephrocybe rancida]